MKNNARDKARHLIVWETMANLQRAGIRITANQIKFTAEMTNAVDILQHMHVLIKEGHIHRTGRGSYTVWRVLDAPDGEPVTIGLNAPVECEHYKIEDRDGVKVKVYPARYAWGYKPINSHVEIF